MPGKCSLPGRYETNMRAFWVLVAASGVLAACNGDAELQNQLRVERTYRDLEQNPESFFDLFRNTGNPEIGINVNRYLWQASLDTLSFLPLATVDPFSGVIVTDWGRVAGGGAYRVTVYISDPALDAASLKIAAFSRGGPVGDEANRALEDAILTRARQIRIAASKR
jgi:hypothetical protein